MDCLDSYEDDHVDRKPERYVYFHGECIKTNQKKERKKKRMKEEMEKKRFIQI